MTSFAKPDIRRPNDPKNELGLTRADYEGAMSTLCAGCGHDSVTAAITRAFFELSVPPHMAIKVSGIGCSSKTANYFLNGAHGANTVHGRMPSVATGALAVNPELTCVGVSGDGDSLSIGIGQMAHAMRRNVNMLYVLEDNGVYGLTKGQFSASAERGARPKKGAENPYPDIDPIKFALSVGATFVARSFSGDRDQLVSLLKAGLKHKGFAFIDVISPCVSFNDHKGSSKSYAHAFEYFHPAVHADYIQPGEEILASYDSGETIDVQLHDGDLIRLQKLDDAHDPTDRAAAFAKASEDGATVTGLFYIDESTPDMNAIQEVTARALSSVPYEHLNPGAQKLRDIQAEYR